MKASRKQKNRLQESGRGCRALCCSSTRFSISSSSEESEVSRSNHFTSLSSLTHHMVQEKLDQMIKEKQEALHREGRLRRTRRRRRNESTKFIVLVATEKCSYDPRQDFRESIIEMILANRMEEAKELRSLLEYYLSMNSEDYHSVILEVFHEVCTCLFLC